MWRHAPQAVDLLIALAQLVGQSVQQLIGLGEAVPAHGNREPHVDHILRSQWLLAQRPRSDVRRWRRDLFPSGQQQDGQPIKHAHGEKGDESVQDEAGHDLIVTRRPPPVRPDPLGSRRSDSATVVAMTVLRLGARTFTPGQFAVMAIVNRTPDSFYDGGANVELDRALAAIDRAVADGADIVDIGGVRAGYGPEVDAAEELRRVLPVVAGIRDRFPELVISVDTWRADVAAEVAAAGADLINDTWAGADPGLIGVAAAAGAGLVCSHTGGLSPRTDPHRVAYDDVVAEVIDTVTAAAGRAVAAGVRADGIVIDPTHDFGKNTYHSLLLTRRLDELTATGWPVLVALSRKDFIGETLDLPPDERLEGSLAATAISAWHRARVFRTHDVRATRRVLDMVASIRGDRPPAVARRGLV